jgi:hypothetical protein
MAYYTWITKQDGKVLDIGQSSEDKPLGPEWEKVPNDWNGNHGDKLEWFDVDMRRIPDEKLIATGKRIDKRGQWYNKNDMYTTRMIHDLDVDFGESWTQDPPLENEPHQKWNEETNSWIVDTTEKEKMELQNKIGKAQAELSAGDYKVTKAAEKGLVLEDLYPGETAKRDALRNTVNTLREELSQMATA